MATPSAVFTPVENSSLDGYINKSEEYNFSVGTAIDAIEAGTETDKIIVYSRRKKNFYSSKEDTRNNCHIVDLTTVNYIPEDAQYVGYLIPNDYCFTNKDDMGILTVEQAVAHLGGLINESIEDRDTVLRHRLDTLPLVYRYQGNYHVTRCNGQVSRHFNYYGRLFTVDESFGDSSFVVPLTTKVKYLPFVDLPQKSIRTPSNAFASNEDYLMMSMCLPPNWY